MNNMEWPSKSNNSESESREVEYFKNLAERASQGDKTMEELAEATKEAFGLFEKMFAEHGVD